MQALMAFENAPPFAAPLRFFLTAPLFAVLPGLLVAFSRLDLVASRWSPVTLAATHLLTVGFMMQAMLGALSQILPVVAGANLRNPLRVAGIVHPGLSLGAIVLAAGLYLDNPTLLTGAALLLGLTVAFFLGATARACIGVAMALALAYGWAMPLPALADLHAGWGLGGWAGVLLAAMAYVVVPMFQLTPAYPTRPSWWFPVVMLSVLLLWSIALLVNLPWLARLGQLVAAVAGIAFAGLTLRLQRKRRRARADATSRYWQLGLVSSIFALFLLSTVALWPSVAEIDGWTLLFGVALLAGGFVPFIAGMIYKIVPFLGWLHLQNCGQARVPAPAMNKILADSDANRQWLAYVVALGLLFAAVLFPHWLAMPAGLAFAFANAWLGWNLWNAFRRYGRYRAEMLAKLAAL